ncbi:HD domain-containing protein [Ligilactobacillus pabuli]|uniref:bis(5'-nucleosyl)-tetraphosphatase (symmetrical) n=1 Tax=Ligilactobacillus pabuli TaxID=2886039 RepID=A0ABQ5JGX2_9LACO|nr:bis(5'-nucleosyl)-tetraphosphatase (symmetrical) YqeK [Ligilactobacillus pabuli]GKS80943.1 HD domain-containing protein [Ligilactobacillus pabuli]HIW88439.1 bis(5'-nucleosyl)-tetraphosphatase (symmetrical) YqeK [Candidatus Ligilactobacillus excrementipullorum]
MTEIEYSAGFYAGSRQDLLAAVKKSLSQHRFEHVVRVEQAAVKLAQLNDVSVEKASIAALCHDYAKERSAEEFKAVIKRANLDPDLLNWGNFIWHGVVGAQIVHDELQITDQEILNAIVRHTVGAPEMTKLDQIIYVADFVEDGRDFPDAQIARSLAYADLKAAVTFETKHTLEYLLSSNRTIYPTAILTYNAWVAGN